MVGEERRGQGQKQLPAPAGLSIRLGFGLSQTLASKAGMGRSPVLPGSLIRSPSPGYAQELGPCLSISLPKFSRNKTSPCVSGDCSLRHHIPSPDFFPTASLRFDVIPSTAINWK